MTDMDTFADIAWAAGFIDGEGSINAPLDKRRGTYSLHLHATQTIQKPLHKLQAMFGGGVYQQYRKSEPDRKPTWVWAIYGEEAIAALHGMLPYLEVKAQQAAIALVFPTKGKARADNRKIHPLKLILQEECHNALRVVNNRREAYG